MHTEVCLYFISRSKDATRGSWPYYRNKKLLGVTRSKGHSY